MERDAVAVERPNMLEVLGWSSRDAVGFVVAAAAAILILVNTLFLQPGPHPAPMVKSSIAVITAPPPTLAGTSTNVPRARSGDPKAEQAKAAPVSVASVPAAPAPAARPSTAVVADIQRELSRRGFYDGVVDGRYGPRTDASIRDFEQTAGLKPSTEPNEALLRAIQRSLIRSRPPVRPPAPIPQAKPDPIAELIAPSKQVIAVQRALSEFGYGQIKPTGIIDPETQSAIQKFERERKLPVTGQLSHRVVRELASITGRPLE
jgi:peptidoglycan hydrolase-like protein with peptidoglycan-binding domain